jgi:hypothetical protein
MVDRITHFCLVSGQPLPNLIPALSGETRPGLVILLVSEDMREKGRLLRLNLENLGCRVEDVAIHPYRIEDIRATILEQLARYEGQQIYLNATCGTKVMALGAYDVFRDLGHPAFYIDTDNRQQISLLPVPASSPLADLVSVKLSLAAYGYTIEKSGSCRILPKRRQFGEFLVKNAERLSGALVVLNACAASAKQTLQARLEERHLANPYVCELIEQCAGAGILAVDNEHLTFKDEDARFFANGGWLEDFVTQTVNRLKGQKLVRDHQNNVIVTSGGKVKNEIDLAFTANNRLHLIECKTALMADKKAKEGRADGIAYKLEALRDLIGGTYARAMLVSYRKLTSEDRQRCRESRIEVVEGGRIVELYGILRRWIG